MIVSRNLRRVPAKQLAPRSLEAQLPDGFAADLFEAGEDEVAVAVCGHRAALLNPPRSASVHFAVFERLGLVRTASVLQRRTDATRSGSRRLGQTPHIMAKLESERSRFDPAYTQRRP